MQCSLISLLLILILAASLGAQERVKFPVGVSSKVMGYGHLWAAWRLKYFEREGLDVEVVAMRGTAPAVQALIANSISSGLLANDGPIAAVEQGMDLAMIASGSKITHMLIGAKNYRTWEDLRGATIGSSTLTSRTAFVPRRALKIKGLEYPRDYKLLAVGGTGRRLRLCRPASGPKLFKASVEGTRAEVKARIPMYDKHADRSLRSRSASTGVPHKGDLSEL